jgi:hypothetical protein
MHNGIQIEDGSIFITNGMSATPDGTVCGVDGIAVLNGMQCPHSECDSPLLTGRTK